MKYIFILFVVSSFCRLNSQSNNYFQEIEILNQKANQSIFQQDSAYYYLNEVNKLASKNKDWKNVVESLIYTNIVASYHFNLDKIKTVLVDIDSIYNKHNEYFDSIPENLELKNYILYNKGDYYLKIDNHNKSKKAFEEIIQTNEKLADSLLSENNLSLLSVAYSYIAKMYSQEGKYDLAKQYYNRNIRFILEIMPDNQDLLHSNYSLLAEVFSKENEFKKSNNYFFQTLKFNINKGNKNSILANTFNIAQNYIRLSQIDSANYYLDIAKNNLSENHVFTSNYHQIRAETYQKNKNYQLAFKEFEKSLDFLLDKSNNKQQQDIALAYNKVGLLHLEYNQPNKALENYNLGIEHLLEKSSNSVLKNNYRLINNTDGPSLLKILKNKSVILNTLSSNERFKETIEMVDLGVKTLDSLKPTFKSEFDKLLLIEEAFPLFESGLEASYNLHKTTKDESYIDKAFHYAEKSKSVLLLESLLSTKATKYGRIPENLLETEKQLKSQISYLEKQINQSKKSPTTLENNLFKVKNEYRTLVSNIENNYKAYYNLKYNTQVVSISQIQKLLEKDEILISYFYGNQNIYIVSITNNSKHINQIKIDIAFSKKIKALYEMLNNPRSDIKLLGNLTNEIYNNLVKPLIEVNQKSKLIIIADGLLNYIPFGSLNTNTNEIHYLIENKAISYAHSATLFFELKERKSLNDKLLAFAPSFDTNFDTSNERSNELLPLSNNVKEVEQVIAHFKGNSFINDDASLKNFTAKISNHGIIHLATHAILNDQFPEYSYLAFTPKENEKSLLYISDLYNMQFDADLITLSACETGIGDLKKGEGFMSLSRGFFYSGASSITSTIWKVNDASSSTLMNSFYKYLSKGDPKDRALQKAKLNFLKVNKQNALSHPYYWSGFVLTGNSNAITQQYFSPWLWVIIGMVFIISILYLIRKRKKA